MEKRIEELLRQMTPAEKISQLTNDAPAIERLGIPAYNWWNECLHGVARAGVATVFPQAIGLAATWDEPLLKKIASAVGDEARAKYHAAVRRGIRAQYFGLNFWTPNINIFRDPRWGRGQETYGEDPYLTSRLGVAFVRGLQGNNPRYLKAAACAKHYAVHSGPEPARHTFDAVVSPRVLWDTYLPAFEALVRQARVESVMGAYNRVNGESCCAGPTLIGKILRKKWKFGGHFVSDCGAIDDLHLHHKTTSSPEESAALAVKNGCDLNCGVTFAFLKEALDKGLLAESDIDACLRRIFATRFKLGMFDPDEQVPYSRIPESVVGCARHRRMALTAARESVVLLKNAGNLLPLSKDTRYVLLTGPGAAHQEMLLGNYNGFSRRLTTILEGVLGKAPVSMQVNHTYGCGHNASLKLGTSLARYYGQESDVIVAVMGLAPWMEGEEGTDNEGGGDRVKTDLPPAQQEFLRQLQSVGKPIVLVLTGGSALSIPWEHENIPAIMAVWYPGEAGGEAVADVLFGDYNPSGKLPVTWYKSVEDLPPFDDYSMNGRTYRYFSGEPLYPFGFGLSYTTFAYRNLSVEPRYAVSGKTLTVSAEVENTGDRDGGEVVQLYLHYPAAPFPAPIRALKGFRRISLAPGERTTVTFRLTRKDYSLFNDAGKRVVLPGEYTVTIGGSQPDDRSRTLGSPATASGTFRIAAD